MKLRELQLIRLPGIERSFRIRPADGVNLVLGPNGSGKSSLARAFQRLLWPQPGGARPSEVRAVLEIDGVAHEVERWNDEAPVWSRGGQTCPPPPLPPRHLAACYRLGLLDLNRAEAGRDDEALGREILTRMAGGFDLAGLAERLFPTAPRAGLRERGELTRARAASRTIGQRQRHLAERRDRLSELETEVEAAQQARTRQAQYERLRRMRELRAELNAHETALAELPAALEHLRPEDADLLRTLLERRDQAGEQIARLERSIAAGAQRIEQLAFPDGDGADLLIRELEARLGDLRSRHEEAERLAREAEIDNEEEAPAPEAGIDGELYGRFRQLHVQHDRAEARARSLRDRLETASAVRGPSPLLGRLLALGGALALAAGALGPEPYRLALLGLGFVLLATGMFLADRGRFASRSDRAGIESDLRDAESLLRSTVEEMRELAEEHGLDLDEPDLLYTLKELALAQERRARTEHRRREWAAADRARREILERFNRDLAGLGGEPCHDPAEAAARIGALKDRRAELRSAAEGRRRDGESLRSARIQAENAERDLGSLLRRLDLEHAEDPVARLAALTGLQPDWQALTRECDAARAELRRLESEARAEPDRIDAARAAESSLEQIAEHIRREAARADALDDLNREIGEIRALVGAALGGHELAEAQAREEARRHDLAAARDGAREAALGRWLLDHVREQNETQAQPAVWKAAVELLRRFTRNEWELVIRETDRGGRFAARAVGPGTLHALDELSDGTRAQLLLAVRLGFLQAQESDVRPPLFVDEALTASDPARFAAVAAALGELARSQQRQVFYLTADPADGERFAAALAANDLPPARRIDLVEVRSLAAAADPDRVAGQALAPVPSPAGNDLADYVRRLRVPTLDPWLPEDAAHLAYLTRDESRELERLRRLLSAGAATVGRWRRARADLEIAGALDGTANGELAWRALVLEAFLDGWRIGRARPLTREDLEDSGAVSANMLPAVWEACRRRECDGARLIAAARERAIPRFSTRKIDALESYLEAEQLLAAGQTLAPESIVLHAVQYLGDRGGEGRAGEVRYWIGRFLRAVEGRRAESAE